MAHPQDLPDRRLTAPFRPRPAPFIGYTTDPEPEVQKYPGYVRALILLGVIAGGGIMWIGLYTIILDGLQRLFGAGQ